MDRQSGRLRSWFEKWLCLYFIFLVLFCSPFSEHVLQASDVYKSMEARRWDDLVVCSALFLPVCFGLSLSYPILIAPVV